MLDFRKFYFGGKESVKDFLVLINSYEIMLCEGFGGCFINRGGNCEKQEKVKFWYIEGNK